MGNPIFRFTLRHAETGSLEITEPQGWADCKLKLERHEEFHSLIEYFEGAFIFYGTNGVDNGGIEFIRYIEKNYGPDATIEIDIEVSFDSARTFEYIFIGQLDLTTINELKDNRAQIAIIRSDFWAKFISRKDTTVNLQATTNLDDEVITPVDNIRVNLTSQVVRYSTLGRLRGSYFYGPFTLPFDLGNYMQVDWDEYDLDEIITKYNYPIAFNDEIPFEKFDVEYAGEYYFKIRIYMTHAGMIIGGGGTVTFDGWFDLTRGGNPDIEMQMLVNGQPSGLIFTQTDLGVDGTDGYSRYDLEGTLTLNAHDKVTIMAVVLASSLFFPMMLGVNTDDTGEQAHTIILPTSDPVPPDFPSGLTSDNEFTVIALTTFPDNSAGSFFVHDAAAAVLKSYGLGEENPFYSEYLGGQQTRARTYALDGCGWHYAIMKGLQIRGYNLDDKSFFLSFDQWWKGLNPILNLGLCYDENATTPDQSLIRVEKKSFFYTRESSTNIDYAFEISREYDDQKIFNKVEIGYQNWQSEDISGLDDPQTKHTYATRFKKIGEGIVLHSDFIAASLAIEVTRRQTIEKSKDYKFDNNTFIISINPDDVSPDAFIPELNENFSSITNLLNPEKRYNSRLTPARNFLRWMNYINGPLQSYTSSNYKFVWGEGNYDMTSNLVSSCDVGGNISEKQNINVTTDFLHLPLLYTIEINLAWDDYVSIRNARHKAIGISQTDSGHVMFFIKSLEYELVKGKATIRAWPVEYFAISQTAFVPQMVQCFAPRECGSDEDDRTTSEGEGRETSEGECRTIA